MLGLGLPEEAPVAAGHLLLLLLVDHHPPPPLLLLVISGPPGARWNDDKNGNDGENLVLGATLKIASVDPLRVSSTSSRLRPC